MQDSKVHVTQTQTQTQKTSCDASYYDAKRWNDATKVTDKHARTFIMFWTSAGETPMPKPRPGPPMPN